MEELVCSICLLDFEVDEKTKDKGLAPHRLPCSHCFHKTCAQDWFKKNSSCPYCRKEFSNIQDQLSYDPIVSQLLLHIKSLSISTPPVTPTQQQQQQQQNTPNTNNNNNNNVDTKPKYPSVTLSSLSATSQDNNHKNVYSSSNNNNNVDISGLLKNNNNITHSNPPPPTTPSTTINNTINPKTIYPSSAGQWGCDYCRKGFGYSEQYHCHTCRNFDLCRSCAQISNTQTNPAISGTLEPHNIPALHNHPLYAMNPVDIYGNSARCNRCSLVTDRFIYHCPTCTDYDVCSKCYSNVATKQPALPIPSAPPAPIIPTTSSSSALTYQINNSINNNQLPSKIFIPTHSHELTLLRSPLECYNESVWVCDTCRRTYSEIIDTFYHSPMNYDVCLVCYRQYYSK
eukprot:gene1255-1583_t